MKNCPFFSTTEEQKTFEELLKELSPFTAAKRSKSELASLNAERDSWLRQFYAEIMKMRGRILTTKWDAPEIMLWWAEHKLGKDSCYSFLSNVHRIGDPNGNSVCEFSCLS